MKNKEYVVEVVGRHIQVTEAMKQYAQDKLSKLDRFHDHIMYVHVTMDIQHLQHIVTCIVKFDHFKITAHGSSSDMYASVDLAVDRLQKQIRRWKSRIQDHGKRQASTVDIPVSFVEKPYSEIDEYNDEIEWQNEKSRQQEQFFPKVIGNKTVPLKKLSMQEAIMKMDLSKDPFLVYRSEEDKKLKVMYVRKDGNYGIIQPE
jgi:putative sigma-54 modulation protein